MEQLIKYPGGKWRIANWIISHFSPHKVYVEPFFGSGAVFFNKEPVYIETINDIDGDIVNLFEVCRKYPQELAAAINLTPYAKEEYERCLERSDDPIEQARRTLVRYHQSIGTRNPYRNTWRNITQAGGPRTETMWNYLPQAVISTCKRLKDAQIEHTDALKLIERYNRPDVLMYLDPPYLHSTYRGKTYGYEFTDKQHKDMLDLIKASKAMIVLSGYDNELYNDVLSDWLTDEKETTANFGKYRKEKLWFNRSNQLSIFKDF